MEHREPARGDGGSAAGTRGSRSRRRPAAGHDVRDLAAAELLRRLGVHQVVDTRRAAADVGLRDVDDLQRRDLGQRGAGLRDDALGVREVAGVVVGHRASIGCGGRRPGRARRAAPRCRGPWRRTGPPAPRTPGRRAAAARTPSSWSRTRPRVTTMLARRPSEKRRSADGPGPRLRVPAGVLDSAPQHRCCGRGHHVAALGREDAGGRLVDVAEEDPLHAARDSRPTRRRAVPTAGVKAGSRAGTLRSRAIRGSSASTARSLGPATDDQA